MELGKRQKEIIDAAIKIISAKGIRALTTKALASAVGISEPALYRHFKNKAELIRILLIELDTAGEIQTASLQGWSFIRAFFESRVKLVSSEPYLANIIFSEELFIHESEYSFLMKEMMHKHRNMIMENLVKAAKEQEIRNDIAPEMIFRMTAGSLRLLIKQWGISKYAFDLQKESNILFNTWDILLKIK